MVRIITILLTGVLILSWGSRVVEAHNDTDRLCTVEAVDHNNGTWSVTRIISCVGQSVSQIRTRVINYYYTDGSNYHANYWNNQYTAALTPTPTPTPTVTPTPATCPEWNNPCGRGYRFGTGTKGYWHCVPNQNLSGTPTPSANTGNDVNANQNMGCGSGSSWQLKNGYWACWGN